MLKCWKPPPHLLTTCPFGDLYSHSKMRQLQGALELPWEMSNSLFTHCLLLRAISPTKGILRLEKHSSKSLLHPCRSNKWYHFYLRSTVSKFKLTGQVTMDDHVTLDFLPSWGGIITIANNTSRCTWTDTAGQTGQVVTKFKKVTWLSKIDMNGLWNTFSWPEYGILPVRYIARIIHSSVYNLLPGGWGCNLPIVLNPTIQPVSTNDSTAYHNQQTWKQLHL